jgi:DNA-binding MarR family transcriptional regulator
LEKLGLVNRVPDPDDGRAQLLVAEPEALAKVEAYRKRAHARVSAVLSDWPADEISTFARSLARLNDAAEQIP